MITTVLGTCDVCDSPDQEVALARGAGGLEAYACDRCRAGEAPVRRVPYRDPLACEPANPYRPVDGYLIVDSRHKCGQDAGNDTP